MSKSLQDALSTKGLPESEICYILREITGLNKSQILYQKSLILSDEQWIKFSKIAKVRLSGKPLQYIFGRCYFYDKTFAVNSSVLIPRPETELLVDKIICDYKRKKELKILDIGTGSGCIAIVLASHLSSKRVDAVDIHTMDIARQNAKKHSVQVNFFESDIYSNIQGNYDIIVSNPPYIGAEEFETLEKQVKNYEPKSALFAEENGTYFYKKILTDLNRFLSYKGRLYLEIGAEQAQFIQNLAKKLNFVCRIEKDFNCLDRIAIVSRQN